jgi:hypothetical protein
MRSCARDLAILVEARPLVVLTKKMSKVVLELTITLFDDSMGAHVTDRKDNRLPRRRQDNTSQLHPHRQTWQEDRRHPQRYVDTVQTYVHQSLIRCKRRVRQLNRHRKVTNSKPRQ